VAAAESPLLLNEALSPIAVVVVKLVGILAAQRSK
jgi:hypothetical protein